MYLYSKSDGAVYDLDILVLNDFSFVLDGKLVGCEFVERGTSKTVPFAG